CWRDCGTRKLPTPKVPWQNRAGGVTPAAVVEFPAIIVIQAAKCVDSWYVTRPSTAQLLFSSYFALIGRSQFSTKRHSARPGNFSIGGLIDYAEILVLDAKQITERAVGQRLGVARAHQVLAGLRQTDLQVKHVAPEEAACLEPFIGEIKVRLIGMDGCFRRSNEFSRF